MRNPASDPFALGGDSELGPDEIAAAAPIALQARENARMILQTMFSRDVDFKDVTSTMVTGIEVETSLAGDFIVVEVNLQTPRGELLPCLTFVNREEIAAALDLGLPADPSDWSEQIERLESPVDLLVEAMNAQLSSAAGGVTFAKPSLRTVSLPDDAASLLLAPEEALLELSYQLEVAEIGDVACTTICALDLVRRLGEDAGASATAPSAPGPSGAGAAPSGGRGSTRSVERGADLFAAPTGRTGADVLGTPPARGSSGGGTAMTGSSAGYGATAAGAHDAGSGVVRSVQFQQFGEAGGGETAANIDLLMDVNLKVSVQLGRATMSIREILELGPGFVIELDKLAGEPVDILVNDKPIARGEVVVVDENFGVRVVDIIAPAKRVTALR
ncbi:MAG TPA: flagellar motor switch protein FliN [Chloroflexota bacterium]